MHLNVTAGDRQVAISIRGSSKKKLKRLERAAQRLLTVEAPKPERAAPFGFCVSDTELAE